MENTFWIKQQPSEAAFPDIEWSKPETKKLAKNLVLIGGSSLGFTKVAQSYTYCESAGIGGMKVILPESATHALKSQVPLALESAPSNNSGGFSRKAVSLLISFSSAADGVLLAGDFDRNSETAITIQEFMKKYSGPVIASKDVVNYFTTDPAVIHNRDKTVLVMNFAQLQKLAKSLSFDKPFLYEHGLSQLALNLHELTQRYAFSVIVLHHQNIIVAHQGRVSTTLQPQNSDEDTLWQLKAAAIAAVYHVQHSDKPFEALTTAIQVYANV